MPIHSQSGEGEIWLRDARFVIAEHCPSKFVKPDCPPSLRRKTLQGKLRSSSAVSLNLFYQLDA